MKQWLSISVEFIDKSDTFFAKGITSLKILARQTSRLEGSIEKEDELEHNRETLRQKTTINA